MTTPQQFRELGAKIETLEDREDVDVRDLAALELEVYTLLTGIDPVIVPGIAKVFPNYLTSETDAKKALPEHPGWVWSMMTDYSLIGRARLSDTIRGLYVTADGHTPAAAFTAACLYARAAEMEYVPNPDPETGLPTKILAIENVRDSVLFKRDSVKGYVSNTREESPFNAEVPSKYPTDGLPMKYPCHPGEFLKESDLSSFLNSVPHYIREHVERILDGKDDVNQDLANALESALGISAELLMNMQRQFDEAVKRNANDTSNIDDIIGNGMKPSDFSIGDEFTMLGTHDDKPCRVTDVGTRTITYIVLDQDDVRNYNGPPYGIVEHVADEDDLCIVTITKKG